MWKNKKFSTLLLAGKAATLPVIIKHANAYTPSYIDVLNNQISIVQLPARNVDLQLLGTPSNQSNSNGAAVYCPEDQNKKMPVVITGLKNNDLALLVVSTSLGGLENIDPRIKIGRQNLYIPVASVINAPAEGVVSVTLQLDLTQLANLGYSLTPGSRFYMQSVALPGDAYQDSSIDWTKGRYSEVDIITVGRMTYSAYGTRCY